MTSGRIPDYGPDEHGQLAMECDCGRCIRPVPAADVRAGIGWTCHPTECVHPTKETTP